MNSAPQTITVRDDTTGADLYHVSSRYGPGHPQADEGLLQVFLAQLHDDATQQLVLGYGTCAPTCVGSSQVIILSMNAEHHVVIEQLRLNGLAEAVAEARDGTLWVSQWAAGSVVSARQYLWDAAGQEFVER